MSLVAGLCLSLNRAFSALLHSQTSSLLVMARCLPHPKTMDGPCCKTPGGTIHILVNTNRAPEDGQCTGCAALWCVPEDKHTFLSLWTPQSLNICSDWLKLGSMAISKLINEVTGLNLHYKFGQSTNSELRWGKNWKPEGNYGKQKQ